MPVAGGYVDGVVDVPVGFADHLGEGVGVGDVGDDLPSGRVDHLQALAGVTLDVATVDEQRMVSTEEGFNLGQQWNIAHGVFPGGRH